MIATAFLPIRRRRCLRCSSSRSKRLLGRLRHGLLLFLIYLGLTQATDFFLCRLFLPRRAKITYRGRKSTRLPFVLGVPALSVSKGRRAGEKRFCVRPTM